jgi:hypothetical protein
MANPALPVVQQAYKQIQKSVPDGTMVYDTDHNPLGKSKFDPLYLKMFKRTTQVLNLDEWRV